MAPLHPPLWRAAALRNTKYSVTHLVSFWGFSIISSSSFSLLAISARTWMQKKPTHYSPSHARSPALQQPFPGREIHAAKIK